MEDLAATHLAAAHALAEGRTLERVYNLGSGDGVSVRQIMTAMAEVHRHRRSSRRSPRGAAGDPARIVASGELAARDLGWRMTHDLRSWWPAPGRRSSTPPAAEPGPQSRRTSRRSSPRAVAAAVAGAASAASSGSRGRRAGTGQRRHLEPGRSR